MALTGDLLFVGDAGRPDLVGAEAARGLAGQLYDSLFENLLQEEDHLMIYPGHGVGVAVRARHWQRALEHAGL
jgi:hydroxyacylglutathione hydrolase